MASSSSTHPSLKYRPAIDGLRAVAVLSVFIFHLDHRWLPGGFLGVDIFFVISGYLIASIIFKECRSGSLELWAFYQRRIARIFPVFITVALFTLGAAYLFYSPQDFASAGILFSAAAASLANMKLILQGSYFQLFPDAQPFIHYWSLSVEEQFYVFFPLLAMLAFRFPARARMLLFTGLLSLSFLFCILVTLRHPVWAFYLLPSRAWELLAGCILAYAAPAAIAGDGRPLLRHASSVGLGLIAVSIIVVHEGPHFPGFWPVFAVAGTVGVLLPLSGPASFVETGLSAAPLTAIGRVSYSLYLWHWPIFSFVDYRLLLVSDLERVAIKVALSAVAAGASYLFLEKPSRVFLNRPENRPKAYALLVATLGLCIPLGVGIRNSYYVNAEPADVRKGGIVFSPAHATRSVILMGDSNGSMYGSVVKEVCATLGYKLTVISVADGDPLPDHDVSHGALWLDSLEIVRQERPDCLLLVCSWDSKLRDGGQRLEVAVNALKPLVGHLVILNQPPILPDTANRASIRNGVRPPFFEDPQLRVARERANAFLMHLASGNVSVVDIASHFQRPNREVLFLDDHGRQLYQDRAHLSGFGAQLVRPLILEAVSPSPSPH